MVTPNLIHPVPVRIRRVRPDLTTFSGVAREPVRQLWRDGDGPGTGSETELEAQVDFNPPRNINKPSFHPGGVEEDSMGYLLFRVKDLLEAGVATEGPGGTYDFGLRRGDLITRIGRRAVTYYVTFFRDVAGYTDQGGATLLEVNFTDRLEGVKT